MSKIGICYKSVAFFFFVWYNLIVHKVKKEDMLLLKRVMLSVFLVAILFVMRNSLQGMGFTYANSIAGIGELFGRLSVAFVLTPLLGFDAICYAGPAAWLLADIPLIIIYIKKQHKFKLLKN